MKNGQFLEFHTGTVVEELQIRLILWLGHDSLGDLIDQVDTALCEYDTDIVRLP